MIQNPNPFALAILAGLYVLKYEHHNKRHYKTILIKLLLTDERIPSEKIRALLIFIDHIMDLPESETEKLIMEISPILKEGDVNMSLTLDDTSFAKYFRKIGKEEGIKEGIKEGMAKGRKAGINETAKKCYKRGLKLRLL